MVNQNLEPHVTTEVFQARLSQRLVVDSGTTVPTAVKVHNGFTDMVRMHHCSERRVVPDRLLSGAVQSLSECACAMALGKTRLWDKGCVSTEVGESTIVPAINDDSRVEKCV